ncbi:hypothetical protein DP113_31275 [Brasilonema octagenarum UFV-E1]|uniref:Uncharacterized protein n=1 Tax=Brasilonema sennae CENA114 TaxID=415709 RepID=A0A856MRK7_9CYAN|nr:hypothetical protein [Brasilonema sennae]QDL11756.1 hypothetical protein DP114_31135 [Brasilonema sennae CENA114]QDL18137.1 hypothetical protein DP113_31275 [Brasilonema octagenarum UFV-E1]
MMLLVSPGMLPALGVAVAVGVGWALPLKLSYTGQDLTSSAQRQIPTEGNPLRLRSAPFGASCHNAGNPRKAQLLAVLAPLLRVFLVVGQEAEPPLLHSLPETRNQTSQQKIYYFSFLISKKY